jgi:hypothetical protein
MRSERHDTPAALQLVPASARARLWVILLTVGLPTLAAAIGVASRRIPAATFLWGTGNVAVDTLLAAVATASVTGVIAVLLAYMLRRHRLVLTAEGLDIATTFYRQRLRLSDLRLDEARALDLDEHPELKPLLKTNGYSIPGFRSGWFRLRGFQRAFVALADGRRVLWIPTSAGYGLLLQPRQPQALLDHLREMTAGRPSR